MRVRTDLPKTGDEFAYGGQSLAEEVKARAILRIKWKRNWEYFTERNFERGGSRGGRGGR